MTEMDNPANTGESAEDSSDQSSQRKILFRHGASLRIFGKIPDINEITLNLGISPTFVHRKGDRLFSKSLHSFEHDMWGFQAPVQENEPLHLHIDALWNILREHKTYLLQLKQTLNVDVFLTYTSDCDNAGIDVPYQSLDIFRELQAPFALSIIVI